MAVPLRAIRIAIWSLAGLCAIAATIVYFGIGQTRTAPASLGEGDYILATTVGEPFSRDTLRDGPSAVFFGFTHCPDVCPTTLAEMVVWTEALGPRADNLDLYFVTVDPERDTIEAMRDYVGWTGNVIGVSGEPSEIEKALTAWAVYAARIPLDDGSYTMDHTASVFLLDRNGDFQGTIAYGENSDTAVAKLNLLLGGA